MDTYAITSAVIEDSGTYAVDVTDERPIPIPITSDWVQLTVVEHIQFSSMPPDNLEVTEGAPLQLEVTVVDGIGPILYQWEKDAADLSDATLSTYEIAAVQMSDTGMYTCDVTDDFNKEVITSNTCVVTVVPSVPMAVLMLGLLAGGIALSGAVILRRGKRGG